MAYIDLYPPTRDRTCAPCRCHGGLLTLDPQGSPLNHRNINKMYYWVKQFKFLKHKTIFVSCWFFALVWRDPSLHQSWCLGSPSGFHRLWPLGRSWGTGKGEGLPKMKTIQPVTRYWRPTTGHALCWHFVKHGFNPPNDPSREILPAPILQIELIHPSGQSNYLKY